MNRGFKGVWIPKEIWLASKLSLVEKCLLVEIDSLDNDQGCFASNEYFADFLGVSEKTITRAISKLKELNLIEEVGFNGRKRVLKTKRTGSLDKMSRQGSQNVQHNNTINNTTTLSKKAEAIFEKFKAVPVYEKNKQERFANLTDEDIVGIIEIALTDNVELKKYTQFLNWLEVESKKKVERESKNNWISKQKAKEKEKIYQENTYNYNDEPLTDIYQNEGETVEEFEKRVKQREESFGSKYRKHYL